MDALQKRLMEMEERNPSMSAIESNKLSQLKLFLRDKLNLVKETSQKSIIGEVKPNDYHFTVPEESPIEGVKIHDDSVSIKYKDGSSGTRFLPDVQGYIPDLLQAKMLAEKGDPSAEFYLDRATLNYFHVRGISLNNLIKASDLRDNLAFNLKGEILTTFKKMYDTPSNDINAFLGGIKYTTNLSQISESNYLNKDTKEKKHTLEYAIFNQPEGGVYQKSSKAISGTGGHADIKVEHDLDTGITTLRRRAFSLITFVEVSVPDENQDVFNGLYAHMAQDPDYLMRKKAQLESLNLDFKVPVVDYLQLSEN